MHFFSYSPMWGGPSLNFPRNLSHFINIFAHIGEFVDALIIIIVFSEQFIEIYMYIMTICIDNQIALVNIWKGSPSQFKYSSRKGSPSQFYLNHYTLLFIFGKTDSKLQSTLLHQCFICCWHIELVDVVEIYIAPTFHIILQSL